MTKSEKEVPGRFSAEINGPIGVGIAIVRHTRAPNGQLFISSELTTVSEIDYAINGLLDELEEVRVSAKEKLKKMQPRRT